MTALLEVDRLVKHFHLGQGLVSRLARRRATVVRAVDGVSFSIGPGETLGLVGESGCGKSTVARALLRLIEPDDGTVRFDGEDVRGARGEGLGRLRRRMQMIFQDPYSSLNPRRTIGQALTEPLRVHGLASGRVARERAAGLLDEVGMPPSALDRYPHEFSGGQRQRIGIARALTVEPELLIADEPVSALDVSVQAQVLNLLIDLREALGLAIVFIGHDLVLVDYFAPRIAVMLGGQIVELLPSDRSLEDARHPYTRELLAAVPRLEPASPQARERVVELAGALPAEGCPFWARCPHRLDARCASETPPLREVAPGHWIACFYDLPGGSDGRD